MNAPHWAQSLTQHRGAVRSGLILGVLVIAVAAWGLLSAHRARARLEAATADQAAITVTTVKPSLSSGDTELTLPGNVQANYEAPIYARTGGYLKRWLVDIGTPVKAGQLLAEIDAPEVEQQLRQAEADLATAKANQDIANVTADRWRGLRDTDSVSKQEADEKISLAAQGAAQVQAAQANLQRLRELNGFRRIVAPFDGIVTARNTDVGQLVTAGGGTGPELFRVADTRKLRLYVRVPQTYAAQVQPDVVAEVRFPDRPGASYSAKLERTSNAVDPASRTLLAQLTIDNSRKELLPGAYAEVHFKLPVSADNGSLMLPSNTLLFRSGGLNVATVDAGNHVVLKPVTVGRDYGAQIEVVDGLQSGDDVIVSPLDSLTNGAAVRKAAPAAPAAAAKS